MGHDGRMAKRRINIWPISDHFIVRFAPSKYIKIYHYWLATRNAGVGSCWFRSSIGLESLGDSISPPWCHELTSLAWQYAVQRRRPHEGAAVRCSTAIASEPGAPGPSQVDTEGAGGWTCVTWWTEILSYFTVLHLQKHHRLGRANHYSSTKMLLFIAMKMEIRGALMQEWEPTGFLDGTISIIRHEGSGWDAAQRRCQG